MKVRILQLPITDDRAFRSFDETVKGKGFDCTEYTEVWNTLLPDEMTLENIFQLLNEYEKPENYHGHSLSVSDLVEITKNGTTETYFCNPIGWQKV